MSVEDLVLAQKLAGIRDNLDDWCITDADGAVVIDKGPVRLQLQVGPYLGHTSRLTMYSLGSIMHVGAHEGQRLHAEITGLHRAVQSKHRKDTIQYMLEVL